MTQKYQVTVSETRIVTTTYLVEAASRKEAESRALEGSFIVAGAPQGLQEPMECAVTEVVELPSGISLKRVQSALRKPHAFTIHARVWNGEVLGEAREYAVCSVDLHGRQPGIEIEDFPAHGERRKVAAGHIVILRIESESDEIPYIVTDIVYDTDGETAILDLPEELELDVPPETSESDLDDVLGDAIAERTGWCVKSFSYEKAE